MLTKQVLEAEGEQRLFQSLNTIDGELLSTFGLLQMPAVTGVRLEESTTGQKDSSGIQENGPGEPSPPPPITLKQVSYPAGPHPPLRAATARLGPARRR